MAILKNFFLLKIKKMKLKKNRIEFLNSPIDVLTMQETLEIIENAISSRELIHHVVVNVAKIVNMQKDEELRNSVISGDIINADGQGVVWGAKFLKKKLPERVAGIDLMQNLVKLAHNKNYKIFFLGAKEEIVSKVVKIYKEKYSANIIAGYRNGYFTEKEEKNIVNDIIKSKADILFVAISSPKKENFLNKYKNVLRIPFIMGVGGSFDVVSGKVKRAPRFMQRTGFEWFYRFLQEPRRMWKRNLHANSKFLFLILKEKFKKKN